MEKEILAVEWYKSMRFENNEPKPAVRARIGYLDTVVAVCYSDVIAENIAALHNQCLNQSL